MKEKKEGRKEKPRESKFLFREKYSLYWILVTYKLIKGTAKTFYIPNITISST